MIFTLDIAAMPAGYGEAILPVALAKAHLRVLEDDDDDLIEALRDAAIEMVEQYTGLVLGPRTGDGALVWRAECLPVNGPVLLARRPIRSIVSITHLDAVGDEQAIDVDTVRIVDQDRIVPKWKQWPSGVSGEVVVTFEAGLDQEAAPASLLAAARMFLATLYAQRETVVTGTIVGELPHGFKMLCAPYRRLRV
jgi:uncharacterized phiE125 gp8 family phage protein